MTSQEPKPSREKVKFVQPKFEDANVVEKLGLMKVPRRFSFPGAKKAVTQGLEIIARSEHPNEAMGFSGVNPSIVFGKKRDRSIPGKNLSEFILDILINDFWIKKTNRFCEMNNLNKQKYYSGLSWSFWERIPGMNMSVVEDAAVPGRFWILMDWEYEVVNEEGGTLETKKNYGHNIVMFENGRIVNQINGLHQPPQFLIDKIGEIIESYGKIKEHFGKDVSWVVEMQLNDKTGDLFFLQRHPSRPVETCDWAFQNEPEPDEIVVKNQGDRLVRGFTKEEGIESDMIFGSSFWADFPQQDVYSASNVIHDPVMKQVSISKAKVYIEDHFARASNAEDPHGAIIPLTKPQVYLAVPNFGECFPVGLRKKLIAVEVEKRDKEKKFKDELMEDFKSKKIDYGEKKRLEKEYRDDPTNYPRIKIRINSDGKEARIKILDIF